MLLCWNHPRRGIVPTGKFIPLAEETGMMSSIGEWVLQQGCATLAAWAKKPVCRDLSLALNISPRQFSQSDFVERLRATLETAGADPKRLILEITELTVMENPETALDKMSAIRQLGVRIAMDDFGTGYSSLSNLPRLPMDQLKIDRGFISDLSEEHQDTGVIRSVLLLGKSLQLTVIAEGVEEQAHCRILLEQECDIAQGYYFSRPVPAAEFEKLLRV